MTAPLRDLAELAGEAWLVGGAVRDRVLGRETTDFDVAVRGDAADLARRFARAANAHRFPLSDAFGAWRVIARDRSWQIDLTALMGETIEADLGRRDLTINAIAEPLGGGEPIDPFSGREDLRAHRLRMVSPVAFREDPLRVLRLVRLACELGYEPEADTLVAARSAAGGLALIAAERIFAELRQIIGGERPLDGMRLMDATGAVAVVLPEIAALRGVEQSDYHHLDVLDHSLLVLEETVALERDPGAHLQDSSEPVARLLAEPLANDMTRGQALRWGALLHDVAKPMTRAVTDAGRVTFMGHDVAGAELVTAIFGRLRASDRLTEYVAALTRHHLRLGFLVHQAPLDRRAIYAYLRVCEPVAIDVTLLSVADRLATRGRKSESAIARHLELARLLIGEGLRWRQDPPRPPVRGDELAEAVGLRPGPALGELLRELEQARFAGEIASAEDAIERARELLGRGAGPAPGTGARDR